MVANNKGVSPPRLQWGRDLSVAEILPSGEQEPPREQASMGPRPFGRGDAQEFSARFFSQGMLQWGRDLSVAEMWLAVGVWSTDLTHGFNGAATFRSRR